MHKHIYSLYVTVEKILPETGIPKAYYKCACGFELSSDEGLAIINAVEKQDKAETKICLACKGTGIFLGSVGVGHKCVHCDGTGYI